MTSHSDFEARLYLLEERVVELGSEVDVLITRSWDLLSHIGSLYGRELDVARHGLDKAAADRFYAGFASPEGDC